MLVEPNNSEPLPIDPVLEEFYSHINDEESWYKWYSELSEEGKVKLGELAARGPRTSPLPGPQTDAFYSEADVIGYGGAAGGGKSVEIILKILLQHTRCAIFRADAKQIAGLLDDMVAMYGSPEGLNRQWGVFRFSDKPGHMAEWGGVGGPGDEKAWQGRAHDFIGVDEATEIPRFKIDWLRTWLRTTIPGQRCQILLTFNPPTDAKGRWVVSFFAPWLDPAHPNPAEPGEIRYFVTQGQNLDYEVPNGDRYEKQVGDRTIWVKPQSRTFIPAKVWDNTYLRDTGYVDALANLPERLQKQMLMGDFQAGIEDAVDQIIPTAWVEQAMVRWTTAGRRKPMNALGVDVARLGSANTVFAPRHDLWWDILQVVPGTDSPDGPFVAGHAVQRQRDDALVCVDDIGVGSSAYDFLKAGGTNVQAVTSSKQKGLPKIEDNMTFANLRTLLWWYFRKLLDPANHFDIELPRSQELRDELVAPTYRFVGLKCCMETKDEIRIRLGWPHGKSTDRADAVVYTGYPLAYGAETATQRLNKKRKSVDFQQLYVPYNPGLHWTQRL